MIAERTGVMVELERERAEQKARTLDLEWLGKDLATAKEREATLLEDRWGVDWGEREVPVLVVPVNGQYLCLLAVNLTLTILTHNIYILFLCTHTHTHTHTPIPTGPL